jgi:hypothetical protein
MGQPRGSATVILASWASFGHHAWASETSWSDSDGDTMSVHQGRQCDPGSLRTIAAVSSALLLALSICAAPAHAIELFQPPTNASLAFSPTSVSTNQFTNICAVNYNKAAATVEFVFKDQTDPAQNFNSVAVIAPGTRDCAPVLATGGPVAHDLLVSIVLQSPTECSQGTDYPGKCRVLGSLEISGDVEGQFVNRIHLEPVLLPGSPGRPQIPITPR